MSERHGAFAVWKNQVTRAGKRIKQRYSSLSQAQCAVDHLLTGSSDHLLPVTPQPFQQLPGDIRVAQEGHMAGLVGNPLR